MGLFNLFKSKPEEKQREKMDLSDFFHVNIYNIMSYNPKFVESNKRNDGYLVKEYELQLPKLELGLFSNLKILDVSKESYNIIFESDSNSITPELNQFILFCVDKFGADTNVRSEIDNTDYNLIRKNCWMKMWDNGISIDNTDGSISLEIHGVKKSEKDLEFESKQEVQEEQKENSENVKFKGIDIDGDIDSFIETMKSLGFTVSNHYADDCFYSMEGVFLGMECSLLILYTHVEKMVCKLIVSFGEKSSWDLLKDEYFQLKNLFNKKYIEYTSIETFNEPYFDGCGKELEAINDKSFKYSTYYNFKNGVIVIEISRYGDAQIVYENEVNFSKYQKEQEEIKLNEI